VLIYHNALGGFPTSPDSHQRDRLFKMLRASREIFAQFLEGFGHCIVNVTTALQALPSAGQLS
jgi:hypothetical protein